MASSLIAYYCFNDNDTTLVHDFSCNERHSTTETGLTISTDTGAVGNVGVFNGTTTEINFGDITAFNSITAFSFVIKFKITTLPAGLGYLLRRADSFDFYINNSGYVNISMTLDPGSALVTLTHAAGLVAGEWYTIVATWDGENIKYYRDTIDVRDTEGAAYTSLNNPTENLYIGSSSAANYFDGKIEMCSFYSKVLTADEINAVMETPSGIRYEAGDGMIQTGDLIYNNNGSKEVCTWSEEFDEMEFKDNEQQLFADGELQIFKN